MFRSMITKPHFQVAIFTNHMPWFYRNKHFSGGNTIFGVKRLGFIFIHSVNRFISILPNSNIHKCPCLDFPFGIPGMEACCIVMDLVFYYLGLTKRTATLEAVTPRALVITKIRLQISIREEWGLYSLAPLIYQHQNRTSSYIFKYKTNIARMWSRSSDGRGYCVKHGLCFSFCYFHFSAENGC
jgi:hypothetical protein